MSGDLEKKQDLALDHFISRRQGSVVSIHDAVFGDVVEGGPNYRNVGKLARTRTHHYVADTNGEGWLDWNSLFDDEDPNWPGSPRYPVGV